MRPVRSRPRILSAKKVKGLTVSAVFNNGETRIIDFKKIFDEICIDDNPVTAKLRRAGVFKKFSIDNGTLSWKNIKQDVPWNGSIRKVPFEIGADTLYNFSVPDRVSSRVKIGEQIKKERLTANLTQGELAVRSGTTQSYISRIERNNPGIEIDTLQKVVEQGLKKTFLVSIT